MHRGALTPACLYYKAAVVWYHPRRFTSCSNISTNHVHVMLGGDDMFGGDTQPLPCAHGTGLLALLRRKCRRPSAISASPSASRQRSLHHRRPMPCSNDPTTPPQSVMLGGDAMLGGDSYRFQQQASQQALYTQMRLTRRAPAPTRSVMCEP